MKPTWGLVAAMALMVVSVFALGKSASLYLLGAAPHPHFTDEQVAQEIQTWRAITADVQASR